jgi:hypothetical protein
MQPVQHQSGYARPPVDGDFPLALIGDAFTLWMKHWKAFTLYGLAANAIPGVIVGIGYVLYFIEIFRQAGAQSDQLGPGFWVSIALIYAGIGLGGLAMIGFYSMAYAAIDGRSVSVQTGFDGFRRFGPYLGALALSGLVILLGFILCYIPGIIASIGLQFVAGIIMDPREEGTGITGSLKRSWTLVKGSWGMALIWVVVLGLVSQVGVYLAVVGALVSIPISVIASALMKRHRAERMDPFPTDRPMTAPPRA